jgi:hypothetical protein
MYIPTSRKRERSERGGREGEGLFFSSSYSTATGP